MGWEPYDPAWLVGLARAQRPDEPWLAEALARCTSVEEESRAYLRFADPASPDWRFERNVMLDGGREGPLVLDVLEGRRVGGVEFLSRI